MLGWSERINGQFDLMCIRLHIEQLTQARVNVMRFQMKQTNSREKIEQILAARAWIFCWNIFCQKIKNQNRFIIVVWMYSEFSSDLFDSFQINVETKMISKLIVSQRIRRQWCCSALSPCLVTRMATATRQKKRPNTRALQKNKQTFNRPCSV